MDRSVPSAIFTVDDNRVRSILHDYGTVSYTHLPAASTEPKELAALEGGHGILRSGAATAVVHIVVRRLRRGHYG